MAWTAAQTLTSDPTWQRVKGLVSRLLESDIVDNTLLKKLVADLRRFLQEQTQAQNALERKIRTRQTMPSDWMMWHSLPGRKFANAS